MVLLYPPLLMCLHCVLGISGILWRMFRGVQEDNSLFKDGNIGGTFCPILGWYLTISVHILMPNLLIQSPQYTGHFCFPRRKKSVKLYKAITFLLVSPYTLDRFAYFFSTRANHHACVKCNLLYPIRL